MLYCRKWRNLHFFMFPFYASSYFHTWPAFLCMYFLKFLQIGEKRPFIFLKDQKREHPSYSWGGALRTQSSSPRAPFPPTSHPSTVWLRRNPLFLFLFFISNIPVFTNIWITSNILSSFFEENILLFFHAPATKLAQLRPLPDFSRSLSHSLHRTFVPAFPQMAENLNTTGLYYPGLLRPYDPPSPRWWGLG